MGGIPVQHLKLLRTTPFPYQRDDFFIAIATGDYMNVIYNSEQYSVVEFGADDGQDALRFGGYEIMDKPAKREIFIAGASAESFRKNVRDLIATEPSVEEIDEFLGNYDAFMSQALTIH
jgi:hypothetical protein